MNHFYKYIWVDHTDETNRKVVAQCEYKQDVDKYNKKYKNNNNVKMYILSTPEEDSTARSLTSKQRDIIRLMLGKVLENKMRQVVSRKVSVKHGAADFIAIQKKIGDDFKAYDDKIEALNMCLKIGG